MVVFTCGYCGESLQKPKVEKHYTTTKCRNRSPNLSCMDCFKDFLGSEYIEHTKCITEAERYSGKGFVAKEKKGEKKQNTWVDLVQSVLDEQEAAPRNVLRIIENISKHQNTPRKKPKFVNFVKNVCGHKTNPADIDQAWNLISVKLSALSNANNRNQNQTTSKETDDNDATDNKNDNNNTDEKENGTSDDAVEENQLLTTDINIEEEKPLSKKQQKEKKKREKYEAEIQKAEEPVPEEEEQTEGKKGKKKNRTKSTNEGEDKESKKNKRKRQDTVNSNNGVVEMGENGVENVQNGEKPQKKKGKVDEQEMAEESMCLHEQNVAKIGELAVSDKFNWHAVILSVLEKKGNELPFKRLQKKVLGEYSETTGREVDDRIADKFIKKLKSLPNVRVDKNRVLIID